MRIALTLAASLLVLPLSAAPDYRLVLADGTVLTVDARPEMRDGAVSFARGGLGYTLPVVKVDLEATAKANGTQPSDSAPSDAAPVPTAQPPAGEPPKSPRRFTDEDIRSHPRPTPPTVPAPKAAEGGAHFSSDGANPPAEGGDLSRWSALSREERELRSRRREFDDRIESLEDRLEELDAEDAQRRSDYGRYPTDPSVVAAAQFWAEEYGRRRDAIQDDLADLQSRAAEVDRVLREVQLEMRDLSIGP